MSSLKQVAPTHRPQPLCAPLPNMLFDRAQSMPDRPFIEEVGGARVSFAEFLDLVARRMTAFARLGVSRGSRVAVFVPQSIEAHAIWQALAWLGAWEVPINNEYHGDMLAYVLNDSRATTLAVSAEFWPVVAAVAGRLDVLKDVLVFDGPVAAESAPLAVAPFDPGTPPHPACRRPPSLEAGDVATVIYTSGTTGPSKGVILPWGEFYTALDIYGCLKDGSDALYAPFPINHMSGKVPLFDMAALAGRMVTRRRFSTGAFWSDVRAHRCTGTILLGGTAHFLNNQPPAPGERVHAMRKVVMVPVMQDYRKFEDRFGVAVMTIYGMSECGFPFISPDEGLVNAASCGRLRPGWQVRIVDERDEDVPVGEAGELLVRCDQPNSLMIGYLDRPEETANAMRGGWFHTGDAMKADAAGNYYFVDRIKDAIRRRGENISSFEVETFVARFPGIVECAAVAVPSETGEDEIKIACVTAEGTGLDFESLARFCEEKMPPFMVPRYFEHLPALPYTPTNKVRKKDLRSAGIAGAWDRIAAGADDIDRRRDGQ